MDCNQTGRTCVIKFSPAIYTTSSWIVLPQFRRTFARLIIYEPQRPINVFLSWHGIPGAHTGYNCAANVNGRLVVAQRAVAHRAGQTVRATVFHRNLSLSLSPFQIQAIKYTFDPTPPPKFERKSSIFNLGSHAWDYIIE